MSRVESSCEPTRLSGSAGRRKKSKLRSSPTSTRKIERERGGDTFFAKERQEDARVWRGD
jgi:hypothetical protein